MLVVAAYGTSGWLAHRRSQALQSALVANLRARRANP